MSLTIRALCIFTKDCHHYANSVCYTNCLSYSVSFSCASAGGQTSFALESPGPGNLQRTVHDDKRHQDLLTNLLEKAYLLTSGMSLGIRFIIGNNITRLGAVTRRDLQDRWEDISQVVAGRLMTIEQKDGVFLFAENAPASA